LPTSATDARPSLFRSSKLGPCGDSRLGCPSLGAARRPRNTLPKQNKTEVPTGKGASSTRANNPSLGKTRASAPEALPRQPPVAHPLRLCKGWDSQAVGAIGFCICCHRSPTLSQKTRKDAHCRHYAARPIVILKERVLCATEGPLQSQSPVELRQGIFSSIGERPVRSRSWAGGFPNPASS